MSEKLSETALRWWAHPARLEDPPTEHLMARELLDLRAEVERLKAALVREEGHPGWCCGKCVNEAERLREALRALEDRVLLTGSLPIPCIICGANGPRFYQSDLHECIERRQKLERAALTEEGSDA